MLDKAILGRLRAQFPLFDWEDNGNGAFVAGRDCGKTIAVTELNSGTMSALQSWHDTLQAVNMLRERYPHLFFTLLTDDVIHISVRRNGAGGEAVAAVKDPADQLVGVLNAEAGKAAHDGWFLCFGCKKARPKEEHAHDSLMAMFCAACSTENALEPAGAPR